MECGLGLAASSSSAAAAAAVAWRTTAARWRHYGRTKPSTNRAASILHSIALL